MFAASAAGVARGQTSPAPTPSIVGVWEGTTQVRTGSNPHTIPNRLPNLTIFTSGGSLPPLKTPGKPTDAEKIALADVVSGVIAHSGRYELKGNMVSQIRIADVNAGTGTTTFEYRVEDGGKTLKLITKGADAETVRSYRRLE
jgi:hypothetical protein